MVAEQQGSALVAFVTSQLDEDAGAAQAVRPADWRDGDAWIELAGEVADHARRHDPARVLAEVDAKRRIVAAYEAALTAVAVSEGTPLAGAAKLNLRAREDAVRCVALPYAARPGYRSEWRT